MKVCPQCNIEKDDIEFYMRSDRDYSHSWCRKCVNKQTVDRQRKLKQDCVEYKGGKCEDCGMTGHPAIFDFHHLDPSEKDFVISKIKFLKFCDRHKAELDKCILLCAICHRLRHVKY